MALAELCLPTTPPAAPWHHEAPTAPIPPGLWTPCALRASCCLPPLLNGTRKQPSAFSGPQLAVCVGSASGLDGSSRDRHGTAGARFPPHLLQVDEGISYGRGLASCHFGSGPKGLGKISTLLFHRQAPSKPGEWHNLWREGRTRERRGTLPPTLPSVPVVLTQRGRLGEAAAIGQAEPSRAASAPVPPGGAGDGSQSGTGKIQASENPSELPRRRTEAVSTSTALCAEGWISKVFSSR